MYNLIVRLYKRILDDNIRWLYCRRSISFGIFSNRVFSGIIRLRLHIILNFISLGVSDAKVSRPKSVSGCESWLRPK